jgi:hypothetical protein
MPDLATVVNTACEIAIVWMMYEERRKARGKEELRFDRRMLVLMGLSFDPIAAVLLGHIWPASVPLNAPIAAVAILAVTAVLGYDLYRTHRRVPFPVPTRQYPGTVFTIQKLIAEPTVPASNQEIKYRNKVRIVLSNTTGKSIQARTPLWESKDVVLQGPPMGSRFRIAGPRGWSVGDRLKDDKGKPREFGCVELHAHDTVDCYIGFLPPSGESLERRVQKGSRLGQAIFPVKIEGALYEVPIDL